MVLTGSHGCYDYVVDRKGGDEWMIEFILGFLAPIVRALMKSLDDR